LIKKIDRRDQNSVLIATMAKQHMRITTSRYHGIVILQHDSIVLFVLSSHCFFLTPGSVIFLGPLVGHWRRGTEWFV